VAVRGAKPADIHPTSFGLFGAAADANGAGVIGSNTVGPAGLFQGSADGLDAYSTAISGNVFGVNGTAASSTANAAAINGYEGAASGQVFGAVTGIRKDAYAVAHPIVVEEPKEEQNRGKYLHPAELGQPPDLVIR